MGTRWEHKHEIKHSEDRCLNPPLEKSGQDGTKAQKQ